MAIPSETLTPNQAGRRTRVIDAAMARAVAELTAADEDPRVGARRQ